MNATIKLEKKHFPVLLSDLTNIISPLYGGTFIDCTFGQGGYSNKILEDPSNKVIAIDRDKKTHLYAKKLKNKYKSNFEFRNLKFSELNALHLEGHNIKGIIFDLGYSMNQIQDQERGLSFESKGKLNMKMGLNQFSSHDVIHNMSEKNLIKIFKFFGEEKLSKVIARKIVRIRSKKNINTEDLNQIIHSAKKFKKGKIHNSTKIFQALRIFVNREINELIDGLIEAFNLLPINSVIAVVTFHSIEDKIVKFFFKNYSEIKNSSRYLPENKESYQCFKLINKKPITPSLQELKINPQSRSAKLRYAIKISKKSNFNEFKNKFKYLTDIENLQFDR